VTTVFSSGFLFCVGLMTTVDVGSTRFVKVTVDDTGLCGWLSSDEESEEEEVEVEDKTEEESVVDWWSEGSLSVCMVRWHRCKLDDRKKFCDLLRSKMPHGTQVLGYAGKSGMCGIFYVAILGFPFRFASWDGVKEHFCLKFDDGSLLSDEAYVMFMGEGTNMDIEMKVFQDRLFKEKSLDVMFGERLGVSSERVSEAPFVKIAGDMWTTFEAHQNNGMDAKVE